MKFKGFYPMSLEEQKTISAGFGISEIIPSVISGISSFTNIILYLRIICFCLKNNFWNWNIIFINSISF